MFFYLTVTLMFFNVLELFKGLASTIKKAHVRFATVEAISVFGFLFFFSRYFNYNMVDIGKHFCVYLCDI